MKNETDKRTSSDERSAEFIPLHRSNGMGVEMAGWGRKSRARSGVNAALLLAVACGLFLGSVTLPAQDKTAEQTNAVATPGQPTTTETVESVDTNVSETVSNAPVAIESEVESKGELKVHRRHGGQQGALVRFNENVELKEGETVDAVVVINGDATIKGKVRDAAVVIGGNLIVSGEVGDAAVAVFGKIKVEEGGTVHGDAVSVGSTVDVADGATVEGEKVPVDFGILGLPQVEWLQKWLKHCVLKLRPLSLHVGWVWGVAGIFFLFYLLVAVALPKPVQACLGEMTRRPATTFFMGLLTKLLLPLVLLILAVTGIGLIVVPFVLAALFFGAIIGKVAFLEYLGYSIQRAFGIAETAKPVIAFLIGSLILTALYLIPVLGLITFAVTGLWGLGAAVTAVFGSMRREMPEKPAPFPTTPATPPAGGSLGGFALMPVGGESAGTAQFVATPEAVAPNATAPEQGGFAAPIPQGAAATPASMAVAMPEALAFPRAGFWERMGAAFLDVVLLGILIGLVGRVGRPPLGFLIALAYFAGLWTWKGTTVGGIVLNLKVVRLDGSPMTFAVALVRGLAAAFSVIVMFLGFLWIAWDKDKQGWHDQIAGTVVIRLPRGTPLVCM